MIGSSPDVIMTSEEWHVGVFGKQEDLAQRTTPDISVTWHSIV